MTRNQLLRRYARHADGRVQLVHRTVGLDTLGVLGHTLAACKRRLSFVATPCVDAVDGQARLVVFHVSHFLTQFEGEKVHFTPVTKLSRGDGKPRASS